METIIKRNGSLDEMNELFDSPKLLNVRYFKSLNPQNDKFEIVVRHNESLEDNILKCKNIKSLLVLNKKDLSNANSWVKRRKRKSSLWK